MHGQLNLYEYHVDKRQASDMRKPQSVCVGTAGARGPSVCHQITSVLIKPLG
jgi:hypothetical protein